MKKVYIIGLGVGNLCYMHNKSHDSIEKSDCLIGAERMLKQFSDLDKRFFSSSDCEEIFEYIRNNEDKSFGVLVSGDTGFYSLSKKLTRLFNLYNNAENEILIENIPALSSLQYFSSKLNISWESLKLISVHGRNTNFVSTVMFNRKTFMLTGGEFTPNYIAKILTGKGLGSLKISVGERLSYDDERIIEDTASNIAKMKFDSLSVMIVHNDDAVEIDEGVRSIKDDEFITGDVPMTKSEIRTISIAKMNLKKNYVVYDVGAGTGSVSVEIALKLHEGSLYSIEKNKTAVDLIRKNIEKFRCYNVDVIENTAPLGLHGLPSPDAVFIGGSSGNMEEIISEIINMNPNVNIVINTITLQSLNEALNCMEKYKFKDVEVINMTISKSKKTGRYDMMIGQNPIYIISGKGGGSNKI